MHTALPYAGIIKSAEVARKPSEEHSNEGFHRRKRPPRTPCAFGVSAVPPPAPHIFCTPARGGLHSQVIIAAPTILRRRPAPPLPPSRRCRLPPFTRLPPLSFAFPRESPRPSFRLATAEREAAEITRRRAHRHKHAPSGFTPTHPHTHTHIPRGSCEPETEEGERCQAGDRHCKLRTPQLSHVIATAASHTQLLFCKSHFGAMRERGSLAGLAGAAEACRHLDAPLLV